MTNTIVFDCELDKKAVSPPLASMYTILANMEK